MVKEHVDILRRLTSEAPEWLLSDWASVMKSALDDDELLVCDPVDEPMLSCDPSRAVPRKIPLQALRLAEALGIGVAQDVTYQLVDLFQYVLVFSLPMQVILPGV
jgi:hypothetical protein